jgi:hypothetical protein
MRASVPSTVLAALVANGQCPDPYAGMNLKAIPREPFLSPWWYRTEFALTPTEAQKTVLLEFDGINYAADIWLNGRRIATADQARGAFRRFQYEVSQAVAPGANVLAVKVAPPGPGDFSLGFVDWNPPPPDRNLGLFRPVRLRFCDGVTIENPFVRTDLNLDTLSEARLIVSAALVNHSGRAVQGILEGGIEGIRFRRDVHLQPGETKAVVFSSEEYPQLHIINPRLWLPHDMGTLEKVPAEQAVRGWQPPAQRSPEPAERVGDGLSSQREYTCDRVGPSPRPSGLEAATRRIHVRHAPAELYVLDLGFVVDARVSDHATVRFGIREVADFRTPEGHRGFKVNGRPVLIKGAGWTDDLLLADTPETIEAELQYVRHMNLNCIRCEGIWGQDQTLYDLCDEYGILMMVGWSCHWEHEQYVGRPADERYGCVTSPEDIELVGRSWRDQLLWLRNHPSIFVWAVASDKLPAPDLERRYLDIFRTCDPTRPYLASTGGVGSEQKIICRADLTSEVSGSSGVKMLGPYEYTPPVYWYTDTRRGGAYGFNTETAPGAVVPTLESLRKMIPPDHLWPIDEYWDFHCGLNEFNTLDKYREVLAKRYGEAGSVEEFARKAQALNYELLRPMFEAFRVNEGRATGVIQWMLNAAWPKMYWQLFDWYLMPTGAFYGVKKACAPQQLVYHYADPSIYLVNDSPVGCAVHTAARDDGGCMDRPLEAVCTAHPTGDIRVYDIESRLLLAVHLPLEPEKGTSQRVFKLPRLDRLSTTYFLSLRLLDADHAEVANNFYWLSTKPDVLDYQAKVEPWAYYTPSKEYADLTLLNHLPPAQVEVEYRVEDVPSSNRGRDARATHVEPPRQYASVALTNRSDRIAFFIELVLTEPDSDQPLVPVLWQDNCVSLLPNETRTVSVAFPPMTRQPILIVRAWNVEQARIVSA